MYNKLKDKGLENNNYQLQTGNIISSDNKGVPLSKVQNIFANCDCLEGNYKLKVFYMDYCRGGQIIAVNKIKQISKLGGI